MNKIELTPEAKAAITEVLAWESYEVFMQTLPHLFKLGYAHFTSLTHTRLVLRFRMLNYILAHFEINDMDVSKFYQFAEAEALKRKLITEADLRFEFDVTPL